MAGFRSNMTSLLVCSILALVSISNVDAFLVTREKASSLLKTAAAPSTSFELMVKMPPSGSGLVANLKMDPILPSPSEIVEVRYKVPFELSVEPKQGLAVCTKDGPGGEKVGDVLRYTSSWAMSLPSGGGLATTAAAFSGGGLGWRCTMFNLLKAESWDEVVGALISNEQQRTDEIVLLFERPVSTEE